MGRLVNFQGPEGEHISINEIKEEVEDGGEGRDDSLSDKGS
jgi:hypothetical protein